MPAPAFPNFIVTEDSFDAEKQAGHVFCTDCYSDTVANNGFVTMAMQTNSTENLLVALRARVGAQSIFKITEACSLNTAGANANLFNYNRNHSHISVVTCTLGNSITGGTVLQTELLGETVKGKNTDGGRGSLEFIFKPNETYVITLQNISGGATNFFMGCDIVDRQL